MKSRLTIIVTLVAKLATGQQSASSLWLGLQLPVKINAHWQWHNDGGYRTISVAVAARQYFYRTGIRYVFNKEWNVAAGGAFFFTRTTYQKNNHEFGKEFRLWQEVNFNKQYNKNSGMQHRVRVEERWFSSVSNKKSYNAFRFRYRVAGLQKVSSKWGFQLADEYMEQFRDSRFSIDQNRLIVTANYFPGSALQWQAGYMWLLRPGLSQHIIMVMFQKDISLHGNIKK